MKQNQIQVFNFQNVLEVWLWKAPKINESGDFTF